MSKIEIKPGVAFEIQNLGTSNSPNPQMYHPDFIGELNTQFEDGKYAIDVLLRIVQQLDKRVSELEAKSTPEEDK
jgi:hypothetical protein